MKKAFIIAAALSALSFPVLAQGLQPSGTRAGGPAQAGSPGQVGTPGGAPKVTGQRMAPRKAMSRKKMRKARSKRM